MSVPSAPIAPALRAALPPDRRRSRMAQVLLSSCATVALMLAPVVVSLGVALPRPAQAQTHTLNPTNTGVVLGNYSGSTDFLITAATTVSASTASAVYGGNTNVWTLTNQGTVSAPSYTGVTFTAGGLVTNSGTGSLISGGSGVRITGGAGTVINEGAITASNLGVYLNSGGSVTNSGTASSITADVFGVYIRDVAGTLTNAGTIRSTSSSAVAISYTAASVNNAATGVITGANRGVYFFALGANATLTNAGQITGQTSFGVTFDQGSVSNTAGGTITGAGGLQITGIATVVNDGLITATGTFSGTTSTDSNSAGVRNSASSTLITNKIGRAHV